MIEANLPAVAIVLLAIAIVFIGLTVRDALKAANQLTPARNTWLKIAFIFSAVAIGLFLMHTFGT